MWSLRDTLFIANDGINAGTEIKADDSFESKFGKQLTFLQLYNFFKRHKEYPFNRKVPYKSCFCEICENCYLLVKELHKRRKKLLESFPTNLHIFTIDESSDDSSGKCDVTFHRWQTFEQRITKLKVDVPLNDAMDMLKEVLKTLKEHIYLKKNEFDANREMEASFTEEDKILHVDFAESYRNDQQDAQQKAYCGN